MFHDEAQVKVPKIVPTNVRISMFIPIELNVNNFFTLS